jgi:glyoxylase-like metal-dependent hydrolase (beta-lactamase superfamily II)
MVTSPTTMSRRELLRMVGLGTLGFATAGIWSAFPTSVFAQGSAPKPLAFYTTKVGDLELTIIQDAMFPLDATILGANAPAGAVDALLKANNLPVGQVPTTVNVSLIKSGSKLILMDTGNGVGAGSTAATLELLGIKREAITDVIISHIHPDHIGGALDNAALTFSKAMYHYPEAEQAFIDKAPSDSPIADMIAANKAILKAAGDADQLTIYKADTEILPGILAMATPGHTIGHMAFRLESAGNALVCTVDAAINNVVSIAQPEWYAAFDSDGAMAAETRKKLFGDLAKNGTRTFAYHFPFPGTGYIDADGDGFRFIPTL